MLSGYRISVDGEVTSIEIPEPNDRLKFFQEQVGGYIEVLPILEGVEIAGQEIDWSDMMVVGDEEVWVKEKSINMLGSHLVGHEIVGDVFIVPRESLD